MNVLYLTAGENIIGNGLFLTQVVELLKILKTLYPDKLNIKVLSLLPVIQKNLLIKRKFVFNYLKNIEENFGEFNIEFKYKWILSHWLYIKFYKLPFFILNTFFYVKKFVQKKNIHIIHCRSYLSTIIAVIVKKYVNKKVKVVFDTRGMYPEEGTLIMGWKLNSLNYKFWKKIEKFLFDSCDWIVNVSEPFSEYVKKITFNKDITTIPTLTNTEIFKCEKKNRYKMRKKYNIEKKKVLVYCGNLSISGWHNIKNIITTYKIFNKVFKNSYLLIITNGNKEILKMEIVKNGISLKEVSIVFTEKPEDTKKYLCMGDYGMIVIEKKITSFSLLATKTGEYLSCGLPVIVNKGVGAAYDLIKQNKLGVVFDSKDEKSFIRKINEIERHYNKIKKHCVVFSRKYFDIKINAKKYYKIYRNLFVL